jgi:hypothetical protein
MSDDSHAFKRKLASLHKDRGIYTPHPASPLSSSSSAAAAADEDKGHGERASESASPGSSAAQRNGIVLGLSEVYVSVLVRGDIKMVFVYSYWFIDCA